MIDLILGTAGHIDHGKTALIRALTGTDTDRLPEEKRRGITIELGFALLASDDVRLGIVDVPGHERFLRQMLAGATGMDLAMLVVAADDSVKPQTREHMDVLRMLDLMAGVIVLTKCDLADPAWIELVEQEIRELVADSFLESAPIVRTSSMTGQGIPALREALLETARSVGSKISSDKSPLPFRMAIDRVFSLAGHGTVVTGSVASGSLSVGGSLMIQPQGIDVRVRSLNNHDLSVEEVHRGQRAAINLAGVDLEQLTRGHELCAPGYLTATRRISVELRMLDSLARPLKNRAYVRVHLGTAEVMAEVRLLDAAELLPRSRGFAQLLLRDPVACFWNQQIVLRSESPMRTIGGGRVLVPVAARLRTDDTLALEQLPKLRATADASQRLKAAIYFSSAGGWTDPQMASLCGVTNAQSILESQINSGELIRLSSTAGRTMIVHPQTCVQWSAPLMTRLRLLHDAHPLATTFELTQVTHGLEYLVDPVWLVAVLDGLMSNKEVYLHNSRVGLADRQPKLSTNQAKVLLQVVEHISQAELQPPTLAELQKAFPQQARELERLLQIAENDGSLARVNKDLFLGSVAESHLRRTVSRALAGGKGLTVSEIRELLGTTRKFAVPFCEYLDRCQVTRREGDLRKLVVEASDAPP